jgi:hypothetical protein
MMAIANRFRTSISMLLVSLLAAPLFGQDAGTLRLVVRDGDGAVNNFRRKIVSPVEVEVRDERNRPVEGARVRFTLPALGPGGRFADGSRTAELTTDPRGRAGISSFVPNEQEGRFSVVIDAVSKGREASAVVSQTNSRYVVPSPSSRAMELTSTGRRGSRTLAIVLGIGAAAAAGGVLAIRGGGGRTPGAAATSPVGVSVGGISVGGPQ